jgi:hypothetical protein
MTPLGRSAISHEASGPLLGFARNGPSPSAWPSNLSSPSQGDFAETVNQRDYPKGVAHPKA